MKKYIMYISIFYITILAFINNPLKKINPHIISEDLYLIIFLIIFFILFFILFISFYKKVKDFLFFYSTIFLYQITITLLSKEGQLINFNLLLFIIYNILLILLFNKNKNFYEKIDSFSNEILNLFILVFILFSILYMFSSLKDFKLIYQIILVFIGIFIFFIKKDINMLLYLTRLNKTEKIKNIIFKKDNIEYKLIEEKEIFFILEDIKTKKQTYFPYTEVETFEFYKKE